MQAKISDRLPEAGELADLREIYTQSNWNMRAFIMLRFRHFTSFAVVMAFIASAAFNSFVDGMLRVPIMALGLGVIVLFWNLDHRTGKYLATFSRRTAKIEKLLLQRNGLSVVLDTPPNGGLLSASSTTNAIFGLIFLGWLAVASAEGISHIAGESTEKYT